MDILKTEHNFFETKKFLTCALDDTFWEFIVFSGCNLINMIDCWWVFSFVRVKKCSFLANSTSRAPLNGQIYSKLTESCWGIAKLSKKNINPFCASGLFLFVPPENIRKSWLSDIFRECYIKRSVTSQSLFVSLDGTQKGKGYTAWKVCKYGVISDPYLHTFTQCYCAENSVLIDHNSFFPKRSWLDHAWFIEGWYCFSKFWRTLSVVSNNSLGCREKF